MKKPKINYMIACSAHRAAHIDESGTDGKEVLRLHLLELSKTSTSDLAQITIIRVTPLNSGDVYSDHYWNVQDLFEKFSCPIEVVDVPNINYSYTAWIQAAQIYKEKFDYYILIEDDYYPSAPDFAEELIKIHKKKLPDGGFLNSFTSDHAAISNGICDAQSFIMGTNPTLKDLVLALRGAPQIFFGEVIFNQKLADYADTHRSLFWNGRTQTEWTHDSNLNIKDDIFRPIQYLILNEKVSEKIEQPFTPQLWYSSSYRDFLINRKPN